MKCDYNALIDENLNLNSNFNAIMKSLTEISDSLKNVTNSGNWEAPTKDEFVKLSNEFNNNFDNIQGVFININSYLSAIIDNYKSLDSISFFGG